MATADHRLEGFGGGSEGFSNSDWLTLALGGATAASAFGGGPNAGVKSALGNIEKSTKSLTDQASFLRGQSNDSLQKALKYLTAVTGGDRQQIMEATMPERRRVIDQYDTAKQATVEFAPRGGGQAGALSALNASEASDLSSIGATARRQGVSDLSALGVNLGQQALSADQLLAHQLQAIFGAKEGMAQQEGVDWAKVGQAAGMMALMFI